MQAAIDSTFLASISKTGPTGSKLCTDPAPHSWAKKAAATPTFAPDVENRVPGTDRDSVAKVSPFFEDLLDLEPELRRIVMLKVADRIETRSGHQSGLRAKAQTWTGMSGSL